MSATTFSAALVSGNLEDIISIVNANPVYDTVYQLSEAFIELSQKNPEKTEVFAYVLLAARNSGNVSKINARDPVDSAPEYLAFDGLLNRCLFNILSYILQEPETTAIQPSNNYIIACVISGTVIRTGLSSSSVQIGEITRGLHFAETEYKLYLVPEKYEINAVGACMHLVAAGKEVYKGGLIEETELKERLGEIGSCIKDPAGTRILEVSLSGDIISRNILTSRDQVAQLQVQNGFSEPLSIADLWKTVFP
jgi:hypothetical protein